MTSCFVAETFHRHKRQLRAVTIESQGWFCLRDLARLMGLSVHEKTTHKLDIDQHRSVWLGVDERWEKCTIISESGVYALLVHHYVPENRALRRWLTHTVLPVLHADPQDQPAHLPTQTVLMWEGQKLDFLEWHGEPWIRFCDLPRVAQPASASGEARRARWWRK